MKPPFHRISLTVNIMLLVALLGSISALATVYATWYMHQQERRYQSLLTQQAQAAHHMGLLRHHVGSLRHLMTSGVQEAAMHHYGIAPPIPRAPYSEEVQQLHQLIADEVQQLRPLLPELALSVQHLSQELDNTQHHSQRIVQALEDGLHHTASAVLRYEFNPAIKPGVARIIQLQHDAHALYQHQASALAKGLQRTMLQSTLLALLALVFTTALGGALTLRYISRPITRLIHTLHAMAQQQWDTPIAAQHRHDEIGDMARSLVHLRQTLHTTAQAQQHSATMRHNNLLTEQLLELTSALPGPVFQALWRPPQSLKLHFISRQWLQMMGLPPHHPDTLAAALSAFETYTPECRAEFVQQLQHAAQTLQPVDFTAPYRSSDGSQHWYKVLAAPSLRPDGSVLFNGVWFDVSREAEQAHALQTAKQQAEDSAKARALLQASVSHEIRTPLNAILGLTQLALKQPETPETRAHLDSILRAGMHLRGIINEVLEFSKIDAGQLHLESTDFRLSNVLDDVLMMCLESAQQKGLQLSYHVAPDVPDSLRGDPHRIAQILLNYVNNAIKFTPVGSVRIDIGLAPQSSLHRIILHASVTDTGLGIPADRLPHLFDPFEQADSSISRRFGGTGLGLAIARELAQLMNGQTGVQSQPNHGSTFWFTATIEPARSPVPRTAATKPQAGAAAQVPAHLHGLRVLVVDDNPLNRSVTQAILQAGGMLADTADNGHEALNILLRHAHNHYAAVLMDLQMPVLDGLSATRQLRQYPHLRDLPVIAMTAHTSLSDVQDALQAGMNAHLGKPIVEHLLWQTLQRNVAACEREVLPPQPHAQHHAQAPHPLAPSAASAPAAATAAAPAPPALAPARHSPAPASTTVAPLFDATAVDDLARLLPPEKLHPLVQQFVHDTQQRMALLHMAMLEGNTLTLRAETHKIRGTAATFGQMRLSQLAEELAHAVHAGDSPQAQAVLDSMQTCILEGMTRLLQHLQLPALAPEPSTIATSPATT